MSDASGTDNRLLLLHEEDNVFVVRSSVDAGSKLLVEGRSIAVERQIAPGFKVARRALANGDKIIKYGAVIGSATVDISAGSRVHTENMKSDYINIYTNESDESHVASKVGA